MTPDNSTSSNNTQEVKGTSKLWPWWRLGIIGEDNKLVGSNKAQLSRHLLNLRTDLSAPPTASSQPPPVAPSVLAPAHKMNLIVKTPIRFKTSIPFSTRFQKYPAIEGLSLIFALEVVAGIIEVWWLATLNTFIRLFDEATVIGQEVRSDIKEFARIVYWVISTPTKLWYLVRGSPVNRMAEPVVIRPALQLAVFVFLALALILPLKGIATLRETEARGREAMGLARQAVGDLYRGGLKLSSGNPNLAERDFKQAAAALNEAQSTLTTVPDQVLELLNRLPGKPQQLAIASHLLGASREAAEAGLVVARAWQEVLTTDASAETNLNPRLATLQQALYELKPHLEGALSHLQAVDPAALPEELKPTLERLTADLNDLDNLMPDVLGLPNFLREQLAPGQTHRYFVLFQNSSELRPTGGFSGSLAIVELGNGRIERVDIPGGGPYDFQGSLARLVRPPEPLRLVRGTWQLQDANWFFDFPTSARKVLWFLRESGGGEAQGVIALTPDLVIRLLELTGPIELPQYKKTITAANFMRETQAAVELEYDKAANRPKQFIADLAPVLFTKALELPPTLQMKFSQVVEEALQNRGLQLYLTDSQQQEQIRSYGWAGEVKSAPLDYLAIVRTNIGGGKTDAVIDEAVGHEVKLLPTGELETTLTFTRTHHGNPADVWESRRNVDYLRFYVPVGSVLTKADGFTPPPPAYYREVPPQAAIDQDLTDIEKEPTIDEVSGTRITKEFGKTVFGNWLAVSPGESRTVTLSWRLPFRLSQRPTWQDLRRYHILFQRQAGVKPLELNSSLVLPTGWRVRWQNSSDELKLNEQKLEFNSDWNRDEYYGAVLERLSEIP